MNPGLDVIASCDDNGVIIVRATKTGNFFWSKKVKSGVVSLVATDFLFFVMMENGRLTSFWLTDGGVFWSKQISRSRVTNMIMVEHTLVATSVHGHVFSISLLDGEILWSESPKGVSNDACILCVNDDDNDNIAYGTRGGDVVLRQAFGEGNVLWSSNHDSQINSIDVNTTCVVTGSADGLVVCWSCLDGSILWQGITFGRVNEVEICPGLDTVLSCGDGKVVQLWNTTTGSIVWENKLSRTEVETVEFDGKSVVFSSHFGNVFYLDYKTGKLIWKDEVKKSVTETAISPSTAAFGYDSGSVTVYDLKTELCLYTNLRHKRESVAICVTESSTVVTAANDFTVRCTNRKGVELWNVKGDNQPTALLVIGQIVVTGYKNGSINCLDVQEGKSQWDESTSSSSALDQEVTNLHYDPTANILYASCMNLRNGESTLCALSLADGKQIWRMGVASEICGIATPEELSFHDSGFIVTKFGGILAFEKERGIIIGKALGGQSFPEIISFAVLGDLFMVCCKNYVHLLEFVSDFALVFGGNAGSLIIDDNKNDPKGKTSDPKDKKKKKHFRKVWKSPRIGKDGATILKCVAHGEFGYLVTSNEIFIVNTQHWKHPYLWSIYPTFHEDPMSDITCLGNYIYTSSSKVVRHKMKYAEKYEGLSVGREMFTHEEEGGGDESEGIVVYNNEASAIEKTRTSKMAALANKLQENSNYYELRALQFLQLALFLQRSAFAFKNVEAPISYDEIANFMENFVDVMIVLPNIPFTAIFIMVIFIVFLFLFIFSVQEYLEFAKFMYPSNTRYQKLWTLISVYCELCSGFLAIPIMTYLLKIFSCQESEITGESVLSATVEGDDEGNDDDGGGGADDDSPFGFQEQSDATVNSTTIFDFSLGFGEQEEVVCYTSGHYVLLVTAVVAILFYLPMAIRFIRVDKSLDCIEAKRNFFDWKSDQIMLETRIHAQSLVDTTAERASFGVGVGLTFVSTFVETELSTVLIDFLIQAVFVVTTHLHPPHFDKRTNKMALLLAYSTLYIFGVAVMSTIVDDKYNPVANVAPFFMPLMLIGGTISLYRDYLWVVYVKKVYKKNVKDEKIWRSGGQQSGPSGGKVFVIGDAKAAVGRLLRGRKQVVHETGEAIVMKEKNAAEKVRKMTKRSRKYQVKEVEDEESTSSSDEDDVVDATFGSTRKKKGYELTPLGDPDNEGEYAKMDLLKKVAYQLNFGALVCSMGLLGVSGFCFFYGARYDSFDGQYASQGQISPYLALIGIVICSIAAIVQNVVYTYCPTLLLFFVCSTAAQHDYNVMGVLNDAVDCVSLPVDFTSDATTMFYGYGDGRLWPVPAAQEEEVLTQACPFEAENGFLYSCGCCSAQDGGTNDVYVVLRGAGDESVAAGSGRISECVCFRASNLICDDVWDSEDLAASGSTFYKMTVASFILNAVILLLTAGVILFSTVAAIRGLEKFFTEESIKAWKRHKEARVKELKKIIELGRKKLSGAKGDTNNTARSQTTRLLAEKMRSSLSNKKKEEEKERQKSQGK
ncbi:hypothetical protein TrRE_jg978 [Triparma retinervis]|uniref:Pyrrolo-quinoline quinone repeat domain-containing protein n=1 Tax=Triparma retinervis TaxID=2557542 RepID=A0A9W7DZJ8_9STRA|nr:hypothetical protein TrRE_jg978 [Triparma retinervis]